LSATDETDLTPLPQLCPPSISLEDRLQISRETSEVLTRCTKPPDTPTDMFCLTDSSRSKLLLKMETPLLRTDHSNDVRRFRKRLDPHRMLDACQPYLIVETEGNVLDRCRKAADQMQSSFQHERLQVAKETIIALTEYLRDNWTPQDDEPLLTHELSKSKVCHFLQ
jgi:hypothetical protein